MKTYIKEIIASSVIFSLVAVMSFVALEAGKTSAAATEDQFTITATIASEISFTAGAADVTLSPSLGGLTGGTSTAETNVRVLTNDTNGYTMTIKASSTPAMQGMTQPNDITDYTSVSSSSPDFVYNPNSTTTGFTFAYSISASTTADLAQKFKDDGSACNTGSGNTIFPNAGGLETATSASCWYGMSTTATSTIVRTSATPTNGATTTIYLRLTVMPNSNPTEDDYRATTTFTATTN